MTLATRLDWPSILAFFSLGTLSLATLYPYSLLRGENFALRQLIFFVIGTWFLFLLPRLNFSFLKKRGGIVLGVYLVGLLFLLALLLFGNQVRGSVSWLSFLSFSFQPAEFMKIILIFLSARYFTYRHIELYRVWNVFVSLLYALIPIGLIALQPDLGSAVILFLLWIGIVIMAGIRVSHLLIVIGIATLATILIWSYFLLPYQKVRILAFLSPEKDPLGANYARNQSLIAIGAGGLLGKGFGNNTHALDGFLPESHTDFIFASIAESLGLTGVIITFFLLGFICVKLFLFEGKSNFDRLFSSGLGFLIFLQSTVNIAINLGLLPITGLTLPFLSYGGSSLISLAIGLGIYQALYVRS